MGWIIPVISAAASIYNGIKSSKKGNANDLAQQNERNRINGSSMDIRNMINAGGKTWNPQTQMYEDSPFVKQGSQIQGGYDNILNGNFVGGSGRTGAVEGSIGSLRDFANNPIDAEGINRSRGGGVFDEFAKTGGISDAYKEDYRKRAGAVIPQMFGQVNNNLTRQAAATGSGGNLSGSMARNLRQQAFAAQDASTNAELGLQDTINKGRQWGAGSMSGAELSLQDLLTRSKLGGLQSVLGGQMGLMNAEDNRGNMDMQSKLQALSGLLNLRGQGTEQDKQIQQLMQLLQIQNNGNAGTFGVPNNSNFFTGYNQAGQALAPTADALSQYFRNRNSSAPYGPGMAGQQ